MYIKFNMPYFLMYLIIYGYLNLTWSMLNSM